MPLLPLLLAAAAAVASAAAGCCCWFLLPHCTFDLLHYTYYTVAIRLLPQELCLVPFTPGLLLLLWPSHTSTAVPHTKHVP